MSWDDSDLHLSYWELEQYVDIPPRMGAILGMLPRTRRDVLAIKMADELGFDGVELSPAALDLFAGIAARVVAAVNEGQRVIEDRARPIIAAAVRDYELSMLARLVKEFDWQHRPLPTDAREVTVADLPPLLRELVVQRLVRRLTKVMTRWADDGVFGDLGPARRRR